MMEGKKITISIDAMGGGNAPLSVLGGMSRYINVNSNLHFRVFGRVQEITPLLSKFKNLEGKYELIDCLDVVSDEMEPVKAMRSGRQSSMYLAIKDVKDGKSMACVSAGNTGALMVMSLLTLRALEGIKRPAIVNIFPNIKGGAVALDLGANAECDAFNLYQFALMGHAYCKAILGKENPSIGILNMGTEDYKGRQIDKDAHKMLSESGLNFKGHIEGYDVTQGNVDIVVTDGFSGNLVLKIAEGTAELCKEITKESFGCNWISKLGGLLASRSLRKMMERFDHRYYNGAMLIGLNGVVVKSHGSSDDIAFENALKHTVSLVENRVNEQIHSLLIDSDQRSKDKSLVSKIKSKLGF